MHVPLATRLTTKESDNGTWLFGPSKFIGYAGNTAKAYLSAGNTLDSWQTEALLRVWFDVVPPETPLGVELGNALRRFLNTRGHSGPRKNAWVCVPKECPIVRTDIASLKVRDRIHIDSAICGGRPHIRVLGSACPTSWICWPMECRSRTSSPTIPI